MRVVRALEQLSECLLDFLRAVPANRIAGFLQLSFGQTVELFRCGRRCDTKVLLHAMVSERILHLDSADITALRALQ